MELKYLFKVLSCLPILAINLLNVDGKNAKVRVKIYDHRAYHDPTHLYGKGPWKYFGHGYGIDYGFDHDGTQSHEKGYGFVKAFAREFCKEGYRCRPPDPNFWRMTSLTANGLSSEPYFARPPSDVMEPRIPQTIPDPIVASDESNYIGFKTILGPNRYIDR